MGQIDMSQLPYRNNISCVVFKNNKYLVVQLAGWPESFWKFPQGGIEKGESDEEAIRRELSEELAIDKYKIIGVSQCLNKYDWSEDSVKLAGFKWRGQIQKFYLIEYFGNDKDIRPDKKELQNYKWTNKAELLKSIDHDHKNFTNYKNSIMNVLSEFGK